MLSEFLGKKVSELPEATELLGLEIIPIIQDNLTKFIRIYNLNIGGGGGGFQVQSDWNAVSGLGVILNKPTLFSGSYLNLTNKPTLFSGSYSDLTNKPTIPAAQVQSDWNAVSGLGVILNKPVIGAGGDPQVQTDWNAVSGLGVLLNKPSLFSGSYLDLINKPTIPAAQVQSDWDAVSGLGVVLNKPSLFSGSYLDLINKPTIPAAQVQSDWNAVSGLGVVLNKPSALTGSDIVTLLQTKILNSTAITMSIVANAVNWDASQSALFKVTLTGDTLINNPTNPVVHGIYQIEVNQDSAGLHVLSWGTNFKFPNGDKPIISLEANAIDIMTIYVKSATELLVTYVQNFM